MRRFALIMATFVVVAAIPASILSTVRAQTIPPPTISVVIFGETVGNRQVFTPDQILITQVPTVLIVTFHNNDTATVGNHTFTLDDENNTRWISTGDVVPGTNATVNFTVESMTRIVLSNGTAFVPEAGPDGILFYCIPHRGTGVVGQAMVGQILLATALQGGEPEKGINIRAYWIGMIGIASMLVWIGISYFIIKSSSRHFTDQREHVRKGLP